MSIRFSAQNIDFDLEDPQKVRLWVTEVVSRRQMRVGNISYLFCDIITFDYVAGGLVSGDILISIDRVGENARTYGVPFEQELHRVIIHGVLHLLGQGDKSPDEATEMRRQEAEALALWEQMFHVEQHS